MAGFPARSILWDTGCRGDGAGKEGPPCGGQPGHSRGHGIRLHPAVPQDQSGGTAWIGRGEAVVREGVDPHSRLGGGADQFVLRRPAGGVKEEMEPRLSTGKMPQLQKSGRPGCGQKGIPALAVDGAHSADVPLEVIPLQETGQGVLFKRGDGGGVKEELGPVALQQMGRQDHVSDAEGGGQTLGEGVQIR